MTEYCNFLIFLVLAIFIIVVICITRFNGLQEHMKGYSALVRKLPQYTAPPDLATSIGGRKGTAYHNSHGLYDSDRKHATTGTPNRARYRQTLLRPQNIGFSYNSIVNRNVYSDFYNNVNERRTAPKFKYVTKLNGLNLKPSRYSLPQYRFAMI